MDKISQTKLEELGDYCVQHLAKESQILAQFVSLSQSIRGVLGEQDEQKTSEMIEQHKQMEAIGQKLAEEREQLRQTLAQTLGEENTNLRQVEKKLPANYASQISEKRDEIKAIVEQLRQQTLANTSLLQQSVDIYQRLIVTAIGHSEQPQTYLPSGHMPKTYDPSSVGSS